MSRRFFYTNFVLVLFTMGLCAGCRQNNYPLADSPPPMTPSPVMILPRKNPLPSDRPAVMPMAKPNPVVLPVRPVLVSRTADVSDEMRIAAQTLFMQGLADPKGGDYHEVTVQVGSVWGRDQSEVKTHGWVLPKRAGETQVRAVCPNGLVYTVRSVGSKVDVGDTVDTYLKTQEELRKKYKGRFGIRRRDATPEAQSVSIGNLSPLYICLLLRLGEDKAAESLYQEWGKALELSYNAKSENRSDPYYLLANQWAWSLYDRAVGAHMRGDDVLTASDAALLTQAQPIIEVEVKKRNAKQYPTNGAIKEEASPALPFLKNLPELLADATRRIKEGRRTELNLQSLKAKPQPERIATLIRHLDEIAERQSGQPGGVGLDASPIALALIEEGDPAVEPLLDVMENDTRLTRSVSFARDFFQDRNLLSTRSAAFACFVRITGVSEFKDGRDVKMIRAWWAKNKGMTAPERWLAQLADDGDRPPISVNNPNRYQKEMTHREGDVDRWTEAADRILTRSDVTQRGMWISLPKREKNKPLPPYRGESLRTRQGPSVSDLFEKRALQLSDPSENRWGFDVQRGAAFALRLYAWDQKDTRTLPTLRTLMARCIAFQNKQKKGEGYGDQYQIGGRIARLAIARVALGDTKAVGEYVSWLKSVSPQYLGHDTAGTLYALSYDPQNKVWQRVAEAIFGDPSTGWGRLYADPKSRGNYETSQLLQGRMLHVAAFRDLVTRRLSDKQLAGTVSSNEGVPNSASFKWLDGGSMNGGVTSRVTGKSVTQKVRVCDRIALGLQRLPGVPLWDPFASEKLRDRQCAAIADYLRRYGPGFREVDTYDRPLYGFDTGSPFDSVLLGIDLGNTTATAQDVASNRAIFAFEKGKRVRAVTELPLPLDASWEKDPHAQVSRTADGKTRRYSIGKIYQAEEVWDGDRWRRNYGFVGTHTITKVSAEEVQITDFRYLSRRKSGGRPVALPQ